MPHHLHMPPLRITRDYRDTLLKTRLTCTRLYRRQSSLCSGKSCICSEPGLGYKRWIEIKYFPD